MRLVASTATAASATTITAATAAAAVTAATTTAAATVSTSAATATAAVLARLRFIDGQGTPTLHRFMQTVDRSLCICVGAHFDESETLTATGVAVGDYLSAFDHAVLGEHLFQVGTADIVTKISAIQFFTQSLNSQ